jgi:hypothetical protein
MCAFIVFLHDFPTVLVILLCLGHLFMIILIIYKKPYKCKKENYRNLFHEINFFIGTSLLILLIEEDFF